jgi:rubredoxin
MKHRWNYDGAQGVQGGSGRPHGVDEQWTCARCGARKARGPENTSTGKRVIRWTYTDADGNASDDRPACKMWFDL